MDALNEETARTKKTRDQITNPAVVIPFIFISISIFISYVYIYTYSTPYVPRKAAGGLET